MEVLKFWCVCVCVCYVAGVPIWTRPDMSKLWLASYMQLFRTVNAAHRRIFGSPF
jgi:hypothetical protein